MRQGHIRNEDRGIPEELEGARESVLGMVLEKEVRNDMAIVWIGIHNRDVRRNCGNSFLCGRKGISGL